MASDLWLLGERLYRGDACWKLEVVLYPFEMLEGMRRGLLYMLEVMRCVLLCMLEAMEGELCLLDVL